MGVSRRLMMISMVLMGFTLMAEAASRRPNVIIIQTDDQGFDDVGFNGNSRVKTPAMDQIAREGATFTQFYSHETCAPTRSSLLTGRHFLEAGVWGVHGGRDYLSLDETTLADVFQFHGYRTAIFGKWHVGKTPGYLPWDRGFDQASMVELYQYVNNTMLHNGKPETTQGWASDAITERALHFIEESDQKPFLLYIPYMEPHEGNGPHDPAYTWHAPQTFVEPYASQGLSPAMARLYGMISHVDFQIGRILEKIRNHGLDDDTIIIFMSDNGPIGSSSYASSEDWQLRNPSQLRGNKGTVYENGIRIPLAIRWKNHIAVQKSNRWPSCRIFFLPSWAWLVSPCKTLQRSWKAYRWLQNSSILPLRISSEQFIFPPERLIS
ncbi:MAG: sulfatase-like hydrolase/transferase [Pseudobdellovibrionaceae bacterium]|nr:sulfatase-like hydrolase/transferase [Pseudobdellovibrionaceae bacterium]